jgi:hypothetical protein
VRGQADRSSQRKVPLSIAVRATQSACRLLRLGARAAIAWRKFMKRLQIVLAVFSVLATACDDPCWGKKDAELKACEAEQTVKEEADRAADLENARKDVIATLADREPSDTIEYADGDLVVELNGCSRLDDSNDVVCVVTVTGSGFDWTVNAGVAGADSLFTTVRCGAAQLFDDRGNMYSAVKAWVGEMEFTGCVARTFTRGTPTPTAVLFEGIHADAETVERLSVPLNASPEASTNMPVAEMIEFREVAIGG